MDNYSLKQSIATILEIGAGLSSYQETDYNKCVEALVQNGWKPVNCQGHRNHCAKQIMKVCDSVQAFYNCATRKKFAFLGYHDVTYYYADGRPSKCVRKLWLRILGDNE